MGFYIKNIIYNLEDSKKEWPEKPIGRSTDYTGKIFGDFKAVYRCDDGSKETTWVLQCQNCQGYVKKRITDLKRQTGQCNCSKSIVGKTFYNTLVLEDTNKRASNGGIIEKCKCLLCGKIFEATKKNILQGNQKSCGCLNKLDLIGKHQIQGRLSALEPTTERDNNGGVIWKCKCDCGNITHISAANFNKERIKSCGCLQKENIVKISKETRDIVAEKLTKDWSNQTINGILIIDKTYKKNNRGVYWNCLCPFCKKIFQARPVEIIEKNRYSCGCQKMSNNEYKISKMLEDINIKYSYDYYIKDNHLRFDFYIDNTYAIEFDGIQHFQYTNSNGWNNKEHFLKTRERDLIKNKYCFKHNIPLIRIPYDKEYSIEDLKLETTRFLLTPENEQAYYESRK